MGVSAISKPCGKKRAVPTDGHTVFKINLAFLALGYYFRFAKNGQHVVC